MKGIADTMVRIVESYSNDIVMPHLPDIIFCNLWRLMGAGLNYYPGLNLADPTQDTLKNELNL